VRAFAEDLVGQALGGVLRVTGAAGADALQAAVVGFSRAMRAFSSSISFSTSQRLISCISSVGCQSRCSMLADQELPASRSAL
jgi:hypothetical protein